MDLSSLLFDLHLSSSEETLLCAPFPPITQVLAQLREKLIGSADEPSERISLIGQVERLFQAAAPDWLLSPISDDQEKGWAELVAAYDSLISALIGCAALPLCEDDCSSLSPVVYQNIPSQATAVSATLTALLENWEGRDVNGLLLTVAPPICVFAVTHFQNQVWTSSSSRAAAGRLQEVLLRVGGWKDLAHLLMGGREEQKRGILEGVLDVLHPQLTKDSWTRCEAVKLVFAWTLLQVTRPFLSPHLPRLLPPSLLLSDHYRPENCMLGVRCLHHILLNTPAADLHQFNRAEVVYEALIKHLYTNDPAIIQSVLLCLLDLLLVLEKSPSSIGLSSRRKGCRHDNVLRLILTHMEAEHKVSLRRVYASALPAFVDRMGVAVCRHLQRLERVVLGYLEVGDPPEETSRRKILEVLQNMIRAAWPRMECRVNVMLRSLLSLLVNVSSDPLLADPVRRQLMDESAACIRLLDACSHGHVQLLLEQMDGSCCSSEVLCCLSTVKRCSPPGGGVVSLTAGVEPGT